MNRMRVRITVKGAVQGIGYRPFAAGIAEEMKLSGFVCNEGGIVTLEVSGTRAELDVLEDRLQREAPPGSCVVSVEEEILGSGEPEDGFRIRESREKGPGELPAFPPDLGICPACLEEMRSRQDRRYHYGLISCTACGPRWSILEKLPYDRGNTAMKEFPLCTVCSREYRMRGGRRRHAQTISCPDCGPQMYCEGTVRQSGEAGFEQAGQILRQGGILALKGVGGYQLLCLASEKDSTERLRRMKDREEKPFAVLFPSISMILQYAEASEEETALLESPARPIVLLQRRPDGGSGPVKLAENVCGRSRYLGAMLPSFGVLQLLADQLGPLVVTSANRGGEPIPFRDRSTAERDQSLTFAEGERPDGVYLHDREILCPLDDSVAAVSGRHVQLIRRSRGYVPMPVFLRTKGSSRTILAVGADLKAAFAIGRGDRVILSQYLGDLENYAVLRNYRLLEEDMERVLQAQPECAVCDLHPGYHSVRLAKEYAREHRVPLLQVQHHQAHAASVMAEYGLRSCIGIVLDGTGYGTDGGLWGGEFLYLYEDSFLRLGNLSVCRLAGGDAVSIRADLAAECYLFAMRDKVPEAAAAWQQREHNPLLVQVLRDERNGIPSSSTGRLFDAAASLLGLCQENRYEGECAILLENAAWRAWGEKSVDCSSRKFRAELAGCLLFFRNLTEPAADGRLLLRQEALIGGLLRMREQESAAEEAALFFHLALAYGAAQIAAAASARIGEKKICLSGGCFANRMLLGVLEQLLVQKGLQVYVNEQVPGNDGGIALGQSYLAAWMLQKK